MSRALLLNTLIGVVFVAGVASARGELFVLALPFLLYLLISLLEAPADLRLEVDRVLSAERVDANMPATVTVRVKNHGKAIAEVLVEDAVPPNLKVVTGARRHVVWLGAGERWEFSYAVAGPRGRYTFGGVSVTGGEGSGVFGMARQFKTAGQLFVLPQITRVRQVAIRPRRTRVYAGSIPARLGGSGTEFFGVRAYQAGDSPRVMNWRASARHPKQLYSNDFQQERVADVGIVLDGRERANLYAGHHSLFEHSVLAAAALCEALLQQGNRVGLLTYGGYLEWSLPGYGKQQRERMLHTLARAQVGASSVFSGLDHLSPRMFPVESQIVLVSPLMRGDVDALVPLRARGYQVFVLSPDPVAFEQRLLATSREAGLATRLARLERNLLIRRLQRAGILVLEWDVADPLELAVQPALRRLRYPRLVGRYV